MKKIIVLVADKNIEFLMRGLLKRIPLVENIANFHFDVLVHLYRDPGIYNDAHDFLRSFVDKYDFALIIFDHTGCGHEELTREKIEQDIEAKLSHAGWEGRSSVIVIKPEVENWIWVNEVRLRTAISWEYKFSIYKWLHENSFKDEEIAKPFNPKEAFEAVLRFCHTPRSSSIYYQISSNSSYRGCIDASFWKMINQLKTWLRK